MRPHRRHSNRKVHSTKCPHIKKTKMKIFHIGDSIADLRVLKRRRKRKRSKKREKEKNKNKTPASCCDYRKHVLREISHSSKASNCLKGESLNQELNWGFYAPWKQLPRKVFLQHQYACWYRYNPRGAGYTLIWQQNSATASMLALDLQAWKIQY